MSQKIPGFFSTTQAAALLCLSKKGVAKAAKREGWQPYKAGNVLLFRAEDILEYRDHRQRTKLVKALGWRGRGLYRVSDIDIACPVCEAFAVKWPAAPEVQTKFRCIKDHEGELQL